MKESSAAQPTGEGDAIARRSTSSRLPSLDQFRGLTVAAMFVVNFGAGHPAVPSLLRHHRTWFSLADAVMPMFFLAVGYALRLAYVRHVEKEGAATARWLAVRRALALVLLGLVVHGLDGEFATWQALKEEGLAAVGKAFVRSPFQALVHIALATLWVLPVVAKSLRAQGWWLVGSLVLHTGLLLAGYQDWLVEHRCIDGGPLGFLGWTVPVLAGSMLRTRDECGSMAASRIAGLGLLSMGLGYVCSCLSHGGVIAAPPFVAPWHERDLWTMSQQTAGASYQLAGVGFAMLVFAMCRWAADVRSVRAAVFTTFGKNALAAYVLHGLVEDFVDPFVPKDAPLWWVGVGFAAFFAVTWAMLRGMEKQGLFVRL